MKRLYTSREYGSFLKVFLFIAASAILFPALDLRAAAEQRQGGGSLLETYHRLEPRLADSPFGFPLYLESSEREGRLHVDVYGIFDHSFGSVADMLKVPSNWCDIAALHPNVKACTYSEMPGEWLLTFYTGRKAAHSLEQSRPHTYRYRIVDQRQDYLALDLVADEGPFGTRDHRMRFEALPLPGERTFVRVSYGYSHGLALALAAKAYFAIFSRDKVGFTVKGTDSKGDLIYIGGPRGAIERNVVRYYLGIKSFMDTHNYPEESRFQMRISQWYDLADRYRKQLHDLEKKEYLTLKTEEHKQQQTLQRTSATHLP